MYGLGFFDKKEANHTYKDSAIARPAFMGVMAARKNSLNSNPVTRTEIKEAIKRASNRIGEIPVGLSQDIRADRRRDREGDQHAHQAAADQAASSSESVSKEEEKLSESSIDVDEQLYILFSDPSYVEELTAKAMPVSNIDKHITKKRPLRAHTLGASNQILIGNDAVTPRLSNQKPLHNSQNKRNFSCKKYAANRSFMQRHQNRDAQLHKDLTEILERSIILLK